MYAADANSLEELVYHGNPLVPFVATDVSGGPSSVDCSDEGIVVDVAVPHEPIGVVPAWDILRTTYVVQDDLTVTSGATKEIDDNVLPQDLDAKYPDLAKHSAFASCRVAG